MLVLALDTATSRITAGVVELPPEPAARPRTLARCDAEGARAHAELLTPGIASALDTAGATLADLAAVVCGRGPGPFTGLRVGLVTAIALGDTLGIPVHGVVTHDALAAAVERPAGAVLAVTDARRREVYWAGVLDGVRTHGPEVTTPAVLRERLDGAPAGSGGDQGLPAIAVVVGDAAEQITGAPSPVAGPTPESLVAVAAGALRAGPHASPPGPLTPLYLRRPDAVPPGAPKAVTPRQAAPSPVTPSPTTPKAGTR